MAIVHLEYIHQFSLVLVVRVTDINDVLLVVVVAGRLFAPHRRP